MNRIRQFLLWLLAELALALIVHWLVQRGGHRFVRTRRWIGEVTQPRRWRN